MNTENASLDQCASLARSAFAEAPARRVSDVSLYLAHVAAGQSMRSLARRKGAQPSTVLRAVRRVEALRDDPLIDAVIATLEDRATPSPPGAPPPGPDADPGAETALNAGVPASDDDAFSTLSDDDPEHGPELAKETDMRNAAAEPTPFPARSAGGERPAREEISALSRLAEPEAFLMVATGAEKAGVFCAKNQFKRPLAMIALDSATKFLANDWVRCAAKSALSAKYAITEAGRSALRRHIASDGPPRAVGYAETPSPFADQHQMAGERRVANPKTGEIETIRVNLGESPLGWLAKRKDAKGDPLLTTEEVEAGERLREDYEMAQIGPRLGQDWRRFLTPSSNASSGGRTPSEGPMFARERVKGAVDVLGPGLSDAAIRICCFLEGLEATEKRMGWSARSGKVVLKLALQRLVDHYGLRAGPRHAA